MLIYKIVVEEVKSEGRLDEIRTYLSLALLFRPSELIILQSAEFHIVLRFRPTTLSHV